MRNWVFVLAFFALTLLGAVGAGGAAFVPGAASALVGMAAVVAPQVFVLRRLRLAGRPGRGGERAFSWWSMRFSLTLLFLAAGVRGLHEGGWLVGAWFVAGVVAGVAVSVGLAVRAGRGAGAEEEGR